MIMKVEQFINKNQFHIYGNGIHELQSYYSLVVKIKRDGTIILGLDWDYSTTTSKHVYLFLEEYGNIDFYKVKNKKDYIRKLIESGKIIYDEKMC